MSVFKFEITIIPNWLKEIIINYLDIIKIFLGFCSVVFGAFLNIDWTKYWLCENHPISLGLKCLLCDHALLWFLLSSILLLIISIVEKVKGGSYATIKKELELNKKKLQLLNDNMKELLNGQLMAFARNELKFGAENLNQERISVYWIRKEDREVKYLYPVARFSSNPDYAKIRNRRYPIEKGCIGQAYRHDWCFDGNVNDITSISKYLYTEEELQEINMKSKTYAACKIKDSDNNIFGIIVVEHLKPDAWVENTVKTKLQLQADRLAKMFKILNEYIKDKYTDNNIDNGQRRKPW